MLAVAAAVKYQYDRSGRSAGVATNSANIPGGICDHTVTSWQSPFPVSRDNHQLSRIQIMVSRFKLSLYLTVSEDDLIITTDLKNGS